MKKILKLNLLIVALMAIFAGSCTKEVPEPVACFTASKETITLGEKVEFTLCSKADMVTIWTGDAGRDYTKREVTGETRYVARDTGVFVTTESYSYTYKNPGTYNVYLIASNVGNDGEDVKTAMTQIEITVVE